jgi:replicative DNA helicase
MIRKELENMALHKMNDGCVERALNEIRYAEQIRKEAVCTGYGYLDKLLGGMMPGELYLIGARPRMGKSIFTFNLLRSMCVENGTPAMLFSLEASAEFVIRTMIYSVSGVSGEIESIEALKSYEQAADAIEKAPLLIDDAFDLTVDGIIRRCREAIKKKAIRIVFLDSWDHIHFCSEPDRKEIIEAFRKIKSLASELGLTIVINMNLSREIEEDYRGRHIPEIYDFRIPDEALDEAAGLITLYRDSYYRAIIVKDRDEYERTFKDTLQLYVLRSRVSNSIGTLLVFSLYNKRIDDDSYFGTDSDAWYLDEVDDEGDEWINYRVMKEYETYFEEYEERERWKKRGI